jgi:nitronate monooxygenase
MDADVPQRTWVVAVSSSLQRALAFAQRFNLLLPVLMAPMAGVPSMALAAGAAQAGAMGALGALLMEPPGIAAWVAQFRQATERPLQINLWVPDPPPLRDSTHEALVRDFLGLHGPVVGAAAGDAQPPDFGAQCAALLAAKPAAASSIMGLFPPAFVDELRRSGIAWFATVTTVAEARAAEAAGADVIVAQGAEAGGHRGAFSAAQAQVQAVGLFALLPQVVDAVRVPVVATGGIADARTAAAAIMLGASAVQIGSAFLRCPESGIAPAWAHALGHAAAEDTQLTRAFSGRWGRALATDYVRAAAAVPAPEPAPYPVQRGLTAAMRKAAELANDVQHMQAWAGQSAALGRDLPVAEWVQQLWAGTCEMLDPKTLDSKRADPARRA